MSKNDDAFPNNILEYKDSQTGLTKREYAAIQIMAGFAANPDVVGDRESVAKEVVKWADELFAELNK